MSEVVLAVGDSRLEVLLGCGDEAGERERPLPSIRPPPIFLVDIVFDLKGLGAS